ncbi:MAG: phosphate ABC transporter permease PstA [Acidimicrobiales bacterium]
MRDAGLALHAQNRGRHRRDRLATAAMLLAVVLTLAPLAWVLAYVSAQGLKFLGPRFLAETPPGSPAAAGGGFYNGIIGTFEVVGIAMALAAPIGILTAVYLVEYGRGRAAGVIRFVTDVLVGIPSIVVGAFIYAAWVLRFGFSGFAGSLSLAVVVLPLVVRSSEEMLKLVPSSLREASYALGIPRWKTIMRVVLPTAGAGITTGVMLALARAAGETAPLLLTALGNDLFVEYNPTERMSTLSLLIFGNAISGFRAAQARAWAGALTLIMMVLVLTITARVLGARRDRSLRQSM